MLFGVLYARFYDRRKIKWRFRLCILIWYYSTAFVALKSIQLNRHANAKRQKGPYSLQFRCLGFVDFSPKRGSMIIIILTEQKITKLYVCASSTFSFRMEHRFVYLKSVNHWKLECVNGWHKIYIFAPFPFPLLFFIIWSCHKMQCTQCRPMLVSVPVAVSIFFSIFIEFFINAPFFY